MNLLMQSKVLVIYTGGTIGMIKDPKTGELSNFDFNHFTSQVPEINRLNIDLTTISVQKPIDSAEMTPSNWIEIAEIIEQNYNQFDGFVVLHGTDTMAYTASALSFMLEGLKKPVILTGSQLPVGIIRTDGKEHIITSLEIASSKNETGEAYIQEVAIYFDHHLLRGNRSTKDSASNFHAFKSPNCIELAKAGVELKFNNTAFVKSNKVNLKINKNLNEKIALIKFYPGMNFNSLKHLIDKLKIDALIIETFGHGNVPADDSMIATFEKFIQDGGIILNITQANKGSVHQGMYQSSSKLKEIGVVSGGDMTTESAITKLMVFLNLGDPKRVKQILSENIIGELSILMY